MSDSTREENNFWNGSITKNGQNVSTRNPDRTPANTDIYNYDFTGSPYFPPGVDRLDQIFTAQAQSPGSGLDGYLPHFWGAALEVIPPALEISKNVKNKLVDKTDYEVGDTVVYTIIARNTVADTVAKNVTIEDELPEGLEFIEGTLQASHNTVPEFNDGKITANFGHVSDTDERIVTLEARILNSQAGNTINNVASVKSDGLDPVTAETEFTVKPNPLLESQKTAVIAEKAEDNLDSEHPEVGDTLLYSIQTRNTITDTTVKNLVISDSIPSELKYVPGSLTVDGVAVTDAEGDDSGYYSSSKVAGQFGDVSDLNWHTVQFKAVVQPGQAGRDIINIAEVNGDNVDTPDRPREEVEIYPRNPQIESEKFATNVDASKATYEVGDTVSYTIRTRAVVNDTYLENLTISDTLPAGLQYVPGSLKVDGVSVTDSEDNDAGYSVSGQVYGSYGNVEDMNWHTLEFQAVILTGQGGQTIQNTGKITGDNIEQPGEPTEKIVVEEEPPIVGPPVDPEEPGNGGGGGGGSDDDDDDSRSPLIESEKSAKDMNGGSMEVGDTIEYTIRARNTVSNSSVTNMIISDDLPEELEYVPGTLKVGGVTVTDNDDSDKGEYVNGTVTGSFGTVTGTGWNVLEFQAKIVKGDKGDKIKNVGKVDGDNLDDPDQPSEEITIDDLTPVLESEKEANDLNSGTVQVGDVIEYTIRTRNTVAGSVVKNLEISDALRAELEYAPGSLKVDGITVTDAQDSDKGAYVNGTVSGQFGDITDTGWHTIVFQAKLIAGQNGQTIRNTAEVNGDNLNDPDQPSEDIVIGEGSGSNPGIPGNPNDGSSSGNPNNPGWGDTDSGSTDSGPSGGSDGDGGTGQSGTSGDSVNGGSSGDGEGTGSKLPETATNMYGYLLAGFIILLAGLFLLRRKHNNKV
ncbi:isopeptide-forming domain-containing fimbrial protein [Paenibacillus sp. P96]|uniref:Isopeptide-forming domain-containing fimbrial protein n=1 Tax=Paenibacillus zeirhizosphaerae TaxID=2987519 RepID=A0ABT9FUP5_9BACL|nr:isopeptide-forming domain-containing fimbrial protein [Paenibacillus sp. P96]MDP4098345.1 isopeptide-forming domain-containing fimbrial protein [Paenibacillus sp. P96]